MNPSVPHCQNPPMKNNGTNPLFSLKYKQQVNPMFKYLGKILIKVGPVCFFSSNFQPIHLFLNEFSLTFFIIIAPCW